MILPVDFTFIYPQAWFTFLLLPLVMLFMYRTQKVRQGVIDLFGRAGDRLIIPRSKFFFRLRASLLLIALILAITALAGPVGNFRSPNRGPNWSLVDGSDENMIVLKEKWHDVIFLLDASASMGVTDTRVGGSRFGFAKEIIDEIASRLRGENVSLYAFTSVLTTVVPSTPDTLFLRMVLDQVKINEGDIAGTDLVQALDELGQRQLRKGKDRLVTVILFSDGGDTKLEGLSGESREQQVELILSRVEAAKTKQLRMFTIGLGSSAGEVIPGIQFEGKPVKSSLDEPLLKKLAQKGGGSYFFANNFSSLEIAERIATAIVEREAIEDVKEGDVEIKGSLKRIDGAKMIFDRYFQYPLAIAILSLGIALTLPASNRNRSISNRIPFLIAVILAVNWNGDHALHAVSSDVIGRMERGELYMNSDHPEKGEPILRGLLLNKELSAKEKNIVRFNLAQILLKQKKWDEAVVVLREVSEKAADFPPLQMETDLVLGKVLYVRAIELCDHGECEGSIERLQEAIVFIQRAIGTKRAIAAGEGIEVNVDAESALLAEIKRTVLEIIEQKELAKLEELPVVQLAKEQLAILQKAMREIDELKKLGNDEKNRAKIDHEIDWRLERLAAYLNLHDRVWTAVHNRIEADEKREWFYAAEKNRDAAIESMIGSQLQPSGDELNLAIVNLETFIAEKKKEEPPSSGSSQGDSDKKDQENKDQPPPEDKPADQNKDKTEDNQQSNEPEQSKPENKPLQEKQRGADEEKMNESSEENKIQHILEELQRMNEQDQKPHEDQGPAKGGIRPW
jgi:Ca-activated chloride channel family protein